MQHSCRTLCRHVTSHFNDVSNTNLAWLTRADCQTKLTPAFKMIKLPSSSPHHQPRLALAPDMPGGPGVLTVKCEQQSQSGIHGTRRHIHTNTDSSKPWAKERRITFRSKRWKINNCSNQSLNFISITMKLRHPNYLKINAFFCQ